MWSGFCKCDVSATEQSKMVKRSEKIKKALKDAFSKGYNMGIVGIRLLRVPR